MKKRGVTLIELIIVMAIFSIILVVVASALRSTGLVFSRTNDSANIQNQTLILSRLITEDLKYSTDVTIIDTSVTNKPGTFNENFNYIYVENGKIYLKVPNQGPRLLSDTGSVSQSVVFTNNNNRSIKMELTLTKGNTTYTTETVIALLNLESTDEITGTSGSCIEFKTGKLLAQEVLPDLVAFDLLSSENPSLTQDYTSEDIGVNGIKIDSENSIITLNTPITIVNDTKNAYLTPKIIFKGDKFEVALDESKVEYDVNNAYPIDFYNKQVKLIASNYSGKLREYTVDLDIHLFPTINNLTLEGNTSGVSKVTDGQLEADFDFGFEPDSYQVRWYVADESEGADLEKLYDDYTNGKFVPVAIVDNTKTIEVSSYLNMLENKIVFYDVVPMVDGQTGNISASINN